MRKVLFIIPTLAFVYLAMEFLSFLVLTGTKYIRPSTFLSSIDSYFAETNDSDLRKYLSGGEYHPLLGWDSRPGSEETQRNCLGELWTQSFDVDTARSTPESFEPTLIASYGDSYVKGGEINNDQTWQFQLSKDTGIGVKNYAVGAYGTYQALLKVKLHISESRVYPVTILGINEQNIERVVNLYRPFIYERASEFSFKPGLACEDSTCIAVNNLLSSDVKSIEDVKILAGKAAKLDYWAQHRPASEFPWSINLIKLVRLAASNLISDVREPLWESQEGLAAMDFIISEFHDVVRKAGSLPVVLFLPTRPEEAVRASYDAYKFRIQQQYPDLVVLDVMDSEFDPKSFKLKPTACHPSAYGHSIIADTVRSGLADVLAGH